MGPQSLLKTYAAVADRALDDVLSESRLGKSVLLDAMRYSTLAPAKRLRPALCMAASVGCGGSVEDAVLAAASLEMIHTFSLIHDDLPAMDNDDLRRGLPTCHIKFGEATAILAGDTLIAVAFETLCRLPVDQIPSAVQILALALGLEGLGGGQHLDVASEGLSVDIETVERIHRLKTGALIAASCEMGALVAGAPADQRAAIRHFGEEIGLAFQIVDDILDVTQSSETLGKPAMSDVGLQKATYPAVIGLEASVAEADRRYNQAISALDSAGLAMPELRQLAMFITARDR